MEKLVKFGIEHLTQVNGKLIVSFIEEIREREWKFVNIKEVKIIDTDDLNQKTIIRFTAAEGNWKEDKTGKSIQCFPYLFICQHAKDMCCSNYYIQAILNLTIDDFINL